MPVTQAGRHYQGAEVALRGGLLPQIIAAAGNLTAFNVEDAASLVATVHAHSFVITAMTGTNNDIGVVARATGDQSAVTIALVDPSANDADLGVEVTGTDIVVNLATDGSGAITSTADEVIAAINAHATAKHLVFAQRAPGDDGTGVVTALTETALGEPTGTGASLTLKLQTQSAGAANWYDVGTLTAITAVGTDGRAFGPLADSARWNIALNNADNRFALSIEATAQRTG
jgi:hypothetical protein